MKSWLNKQWHKYYKPSSRVLTFVVTIVIMAWSFPDNDMLRYDYEVHRPWRYSDLIAPFDFPIYKTSAEIASERDSIMRNTRPYFRRQEISEREVRTSVLQMIQQNKSKIQLICPKNVPTDSVRMFMQHRLVRILTAIYDKGVIETPDDVVQANPNSYELMMITGNVSEAFLMSEFLTMKDAYSKLVSQLRSEVAVRFRAESSWPTTLMERMPIADIISTNIVYDQEKTAAIKSEKLEKMSFTEGKVFAGQKIISTGDIVDRYTAKVLDSLKRVSEPLSPGRRHWPMLVGISMLLVVLLTSVFTFLLFFRSDLFNKLHNVNFMQLMMTFFVVLSGLVAQHHNNISFVIPYVILPIMLRIFFDSRTAMFVHTITILIVSFMAYNSQLFILLHIPAGMIAIVSLVNLTQRMQIVRTSIYVFLSYVTTYVGFTLWQANDPSEISPYIIIMLATNSMLVLLSYPLIYVFEKVFGFLSDVTLMELSDTNSKLLRELSEKAPGTFQHSVQVANLAQAVAYKIGANALLARTGAMYHDIGKVISPMYFTENQATGINPHKDLNYKESAKIIIQHVENGVKLARKYGLPQPIINMIRSHHGDSQARFFYINWCNEHRGEEVDINAFTYPGPTPETKEEAIIMMADAVEASSKSLTSYNDETINELVEKIINIQIDGKQFRNAPITFHDIEDAKRIFKEKLRNVYRSRIQYPELME